MNAPQPCITHRRPQKHDQTPYRPAIKHRVESGNIQLEITMCFFSMNQHPWDVIEKA